MSAGDVIKTPWSQRIADARRGLVPLAAWMLAAVSVVILLRDRGRQYGNVGLARAVEYDVSSDVTGRIESLSVDLFQDVEAGQVLAVLDDAEIKARLETAKAELSRLAANVSTNLRNVQVDEERLRLQSMQVRVQVEADKVEMARLDLEVQRQQKLAKAGVLAQGELDNARLSRDAVARRIEENEGLLSRTAAEHQKTDETRDKMATSLVSTDAEDPKVAPLRESVRAQEALIEEIDVERRNLALRSPVSGRVSQVLMQAGQTALPGRPVIVVSQRMATEAIVYVPEAIAKSTTPGNPVRVATASAISEGIVDRVGPSVQQIPAQLCRNPTVPEYGVPLLVKGVSGLELMPGERITVKLLRGRASRRSGS